MKSILLAVSGHSGAGKDTIADYLTKVHAFTKVGLADPLKRICFDVYAFTEDQLWGPSEMRNAPDSRYLREAAGSRGTTFLGYMDVTGTFYEKYKHLIVDGSLPAPPVDIYLTPRYALQTLGTEWGRGCYKDTWLDYGLDVARNVMDGGGSYTAKDGLHLYSRIESNEAAQSPGVVFSDIRFKNEFEKVRAAGGFLIRVLRSSANGKLSSGVTDHASEEEQNEIEDSYFDAVIHNDGTKEELYDEVDRVYGLALSRK
jgi:hypothetical protein